jgi:hypothetical protein
VRNNGEKIMGTSTDAMLFWGFCVDPDEGELSGDWEDQWYNERYNELKALQEKFGCELEIHCHADSPVFVFTPKASFKRAWRGSTVEVTSLDVDPTWRANLQAFTEALGIKFQEPKWLLASYWG